MIKTGHGGDIYSRNIKYDFSANINPLGLPESVRQAIIKNISAFERYPDVNCTKLKEAISQYENISCGNIVCGNGAADLIYKIVQVIMPRKALISVPSFSEYEKALKSFDCKIKYFKLDDRNNFEIKEDILDNICGIDIMFICNPNNPVGNLIDADLMSRIIQRCRENNIYLVIDECFLSFVANSEQHRVKAEMDNVIILKAFTKIFAMPGLRLGYMLCSNNELCEKIEGCGQCWSVSAAAQIAGAAALTEKNYIEETVYLIKNEREFLTENLKRFGFKVYPSMANFIFLKVDLPLDDMLLEEQIAIRNCNNYINLQSGYFRIAVRTHAENEILINAIERILRNG